MTVPFGFMVIWSRKMGQEGYVKKRNEGFPPHFPTTLGN